MMRAIVAALTALLAVSPALAAETPLVCLGLTSETACSSPPSLPEGSDPTSILLKQLSDQRCEVSRLRVWYDTHAQAPQILFRIVGALTILISVTIPFLGTREGWWRTTALPIAALAVAGLTGLNSFFQWQLQWAGFRASELNLRFALAEWNVRIAEACHQSDTTLTATKAVAATDALLQQAREIVSSETGHYFEATHFEKAAEGS